MSSSGETQKGFRIVAAAANAAGVIASTVVITLVLFGCAPTYTTTGSGVVVAPVSLHQEPSESTKTTGDLKAGESVEILQYVPHKAMDSWILVRSAKDRKAQGYALLSSIDHIKTGNAELDVWHATQLAGKASGVELKDRLADIAEMLKTPLPASPATDELYRTLATESLRLASDRIENKDEARAAVSSAETYLSRISRDPQVDDAVAEIRSSIQHIQVALGDVAAPEPVQPQVASPSPKGELSRLMKDASAAFASGRYAKAAELSQQVVSKGQGKRELATIVDEAKAMHKKAETAQEEYEKVNIQNR